MARVILLIIVVAVGYFFFKRLGANEKLSGIFEPETTISDLKSRPSVFADSIVELKDLRVLESLSVVNYSRCKVSDESGQEMVLLSSRPYLVGETVKAVKGKYTVLYADNNKRCDVFICDDLRPVSDLMKVLKQALLY